MCVADHRIVTCPPDDVTEPRTALESRGDKQFDVRDIRR
jgi:hypothetical protein